MKEVIFATGNPSKARRFDKYLEDIKVLSLKDIDLSLDIEETGNNALENAIIKAKECYNKTHKPCMGMDDNLFLEGVPVEYQPGVYVRRVNGKELNDQEMIEHYINLVKKYGNNGRLDAKWVYGLALIDSEGKLHTYSWEKDNFYFVDVPSEVINPGYPLNSISKYRDNNLYFSELSSNKEVVRFDEHSVGDFIKRYIK